MFFDYIMMSALYNTRIYRFICIIGPYMVSFEDYAAYFRKVTQVIKLGKENAITGKLIPHEGLFALRSLEYYTLLRII